MHLWQRHPVHLVAKHQIWVRCLGDRQATAKRHLYLDVAHLLFASVGPVEDTLDTALSDPGLLEKRRWRRARPIGRCRFRR